jgi:hypothetical protein
VSARRAGTLPLPLMAARAGVPVSGREPNHTSSDVETS